MYYTEGGAIGTVDKLFLPPHFQYLYLKKYIFSIVFN